LCNLVFAGAMNGRDEKQRAEMLEEINAPLDPMEQWDLAMRGFGG
jgi:hypothetical protein